MATEEHIHKKMDPKIFEDYKTALIELETVQNEHIANVKILANRDNAKMERYMISTDEYDLHSIAAETQFKQRHEKLILSYNQLLQKMEQYRTSYKHYIKSYNQIEKRLDKGVP